MKQSRATMPTLRFFSLILFLSNVTVVDAIKSTKTTVSTTIEAMKTLRTKGTHDKDVTMDEKQQHKLTRNLLHWGNHRDSNASITGKIEHVTVNPFVLVIGPSLRPLSKEETNEIRNVIRTTIIKNMRASVIKSMNQIQELLFAGSRVKFQGHREGNDHDHEAHRMVRARKLNKTKINDYGSWILNNEYTTSTAAPYYQPNTISISMEGGEAEFSHSQLYETPEVDFFNQFIHQILSDKILPEIQEQISTLSNLKFANIYNEIATPPPLHSPQIPTKIRSSEGNNDDSPIIIRLFVPTQSPTNTLITALRDEGNGTNNDSWRYEMRDFLIGTALGTTIVLIGYGIMKRIKSSSRIDKTLSSRKRTSKHDYDSPPSSDEFDCITIKYVHQSTNSKKATKITNSPSEKFHVRQGSKIIPLYIQEEQCNGNNISTKPTTNQKDIKSSRQHEKSEEEEYSCKRTKSKAINSSSRKLKEEEEELSSTLDGSFSSTITNLKTKPFDMILQKKMLNTDSLFESKFPSREECRRTSLLKPTDFSASAFALSPTLSSANDDSSIPIHESISFSTTDSSSFEKERIHKNAGRNYFLSSCICADVIDDKEGVTKIMRGEGDLKGLPPT